MTAATSMPLMVARLTPRQYPGERWSASATASAAPNAANPGQDTSKR